MRLRGLPLVHVQGKAMQDEWRGMLYLIILVLLVGCVLLLAETSLCGTALLGLCASDCQEGQWGGVPIANGRPSICVSMLPTSKRKWHWLKLYTIYAY